MKKREGENLQGIQRSLRNSCVESLVCWCRGGGKRMTPFRPPFFHPPPQSNSTATASSLAPGAPLPVKKLKPPSPSPFPGPVGTSRKKSRGGREEGRGIAKIAHPPPLVGKGVKEASCFSSILKAGRRRETRGKIGEGGAGWRCDAAAA